MYTWTTSYRKTVIKKNELYPPRARSRKGARVGPSTIEPPFTGFSLETNFMENTLRELKIVVPLQQ